MGVKQWPNRAFLLSLIPYPLSLIACAFPLYFLSLVLYPSFSILYPILFNLYPIPYSLSIIPYALPYISYFLFLIRYPLYFIQSHIISPFSIKDHWVAIWHVTRPSVWGISKRAKCPCVLSLWVCGVLRCFDLSSFQNFCILSTREMTGCNQVLVSIRKTTCFGIIKME